MGGYLDVPKVAKEHAIGEGNALVYGSSAMQGWRTSMEDAHVACIGLPGHADWSYFAIFDGHGGAAVSKYCAEHLHNVIVATQQFQRGNVEEGIPTGFLQVDERMRAHQPTRSAGGGSTAICVFISPQHIHYANCGDSRATLSRCGGACFATRDHKPDLDGERQRIYAAGGCVLVRRVNGVLAVSRALGDYEHKLDRRRDVTAQVVTPLPDVYTRRRHETDEFLVLACDGVWDVMDTEAVCEFVYSRLLLTADVLAVADSVLDTCLNKGSRDNMSITIVLFPAAPAVSGAALRRERQLDARLSKLIKAELALLEIREYRELLEYLHKRTDIDGLPPGGGLFAKYGVIRQAFHEVYPEKAVGLCEACPHGLC